MKSLLSVWISDDCKVQRLTYLWELSANTLHVLISTFSYSKQKNSSKQLHVCEYLWWMSQKTFQQPETYRSHTHTSNNRCSRRHKTCTQTYSHINTTSTLRKYLFTTLLKSIHLLYSYMKAEHILRGKIPKF